MISFYTLPSTVMHHPTHKQLKAAYSFYNVSEKTPLVDLMQDALILAKQVRTIRHFRNERGLGRVNFRKDYLTIGRAFRRALRSHSMLINLYKQSGKIKTLAPRTNPATQEWVACVSAEALVPEITLPTSFCWVLRVYQDKAGMSTNVRRELRELSEKEETVYVDV